MTIVYAQQQDTLDTIAYRFYGEQAVSMLPALIEANPNIQNVFLNEHQAINLPEIIETQTNQTLAMWD